VNEHATTPDPRRGNALDAVRAFGVMSGGPIVVLLLALASVWLVVHALVDGDAPPWPAIVGVAAIAGYVVVLRPWTRRWGTTRAELQKVLPGDELVRRPGVTMTRAVTVDAPVDAVWPWLAQIGQDRGAFYSYAWLENLAGCRLRNADRIHPEWQHRDVGDTVLLHPLSGIRLARFDRNRSYAFEGGWYFALEPLPNDRTRLYARSRVPRGLASLAYAVFIEFPHFVMERKMLLGIKARAEHAWNNAKIESPHRPRRRADDPQMTSR
jgi:hypothetical protein